MDARVAVLLLREPGDRVRVAVEDVARVVVVDPVAQPREADVRRVVGVVVDAERRAVAEQHVGGGALGVIAALAVVVAFTFGLSWVFTTLGLIMRAPNAVLNTGFMVLFPLVFLSNSFVEPDTLPSWLEAFVNVNPFSHLVTALRGLMAGTSQAEDVLLVLGEAAVLTAVFAPLTVRLYRRAA